MHAPSEALIGDRMHSVLARLAGSYDVIIIDSPALLGNIDARVIAESVDLVVMVAKWRTVPIARIRTAMKALGANAANAFVLVYNLYDTEDLYKRFPAGEGQAYVVGGLTASYLRSGDVVLIPIRMGVGMRLGINAGYMKFSKKQRWFPF